MAAIRYISGTTATGDGSSPTTPAAWSSLDAQCVLAGAGGKVVIDSATPIHITGSVNLTSQVGTSGNPVTIQGGTFPDHREAFAKIIGNRLSPWNSTLTGGSLTSAQGPVAVVIKQVNNVIFDHLSFFHIGAGAIATTTSGTTANVACDNIIATNLRGYNVERMIFGASGRPFTNSRFSGIKVKGFSKAAIRFNTGANNIIIEDFYLDGDQQYGDSWSSGIVIGDPSSNPNITGSDGVITGGTTFTSAAPLHGPFSTGNTGLNIVGDNILPGTTVTFVGANTLTLSQACTNGTALNYTLETTRNKAITIRRGKIKNCLDYHTDGTGTYWQSDGVSGERADDNILVEDVWIENVSDGGIDCKATNLVCRNVTVKNAKRSWRIWQEDTICINCVSLAPRMAYGNTGLADPDHIFADIGGCHWYGGILDSQGNKPALLVNNQNSNSSGKPVHIEGAIIRQPAGAASSSGAIQESTANPNRHEVTSS